MTGLDSFSDGPSFNFLDVFQEIAEDIESAAERGDVEITKNLCASLKGESLHVLRQAQKARMRNYNVIGTAREVLSTSDLAISPLDLEIAIENVGLVAQRTDEEFARYLTYYNNVLPGYIEKEIRLAEQRSKQKGA